MAALIVTTTQGVRSATRSWWIIGLTVLTTACPLQGRTGVGLWPDLQPYRMQMSNASTVPDWSPLFFASEVDYQGLEHLDLEPAEEYEGFWTRRRKVLALNIGVPLASFGFGAFAWDYGSASFSFENEGWFGRDTGYGGADKIGHAWVGYALANLYTTIYTSWDFEPRQAALYGALSSLAHITLVEIGDGFSGDHGFSWEDQLFNTLGVGLAYLRQRNRYLHDAVDFRLEWIPSRQFLRGDRLDPFTDYSGHRYLLAFKLGGLLQTDDPVLRALEVHVGYYTRGYVSGDDEYFTGRGRYGYIGLGLNVTYLLERFIGHNAWHVFDYLQAPYTYLPVRTRFD